MARIAVAMLALFAEMERTFARERAAHARAVALDKGRLPGRPRKLNDHKLQAARAALDAGMHPRRRRRHAQHPPRHPLPSTPTRQARPIDRPGCLPCGSGHLRESRAETVRKRTADTRLLRRKKRRLPAWITPGHQPTPRSATSCSSATAPSSGIFRAESPPSWVSAPQCLR